MCPLPGISTTPCSLLVEQLIWERIYNLGSFQIPLCSAFNASLAYLAIFNWFSAAFYRLMMQYLLAWGRYRVILLVKD